MRFFSVAFSALGLAFFPAHSWARPEYAVRLGTVSCAACHVSPYGGGARGLYGKYYGSNNYGVSRFSNQDLISGDLRFLALYPAKASHTTNGPVVMASIVSANVPVIENSDGSQTNLVVANSFGYLTNASGSLREAYVIHRTAPEAEQAAFKHIMFGRFNSPFGLLTDEHRTYVRVQDKTSENDFEFGGLVSGDPLEQIHYDVALTSGMQQGGSGFTNNDLTRATIGNLRYQTSSLPFFFVTSAAFHRSLVIARTSHYNPYALAVYGTLSADRLTRQTLHGSLLAEVDLARGWNDSTTNPGIAKFIPGSDAPFQAAVKDSQSLGWWVQANYDVTPRFVLMVKYESLALDRRFPADAFVRHGFGFKYFMNSNMNVAVRYETSQAGRSSITSDQVANARNGVLAVFNLWI